MGKPEVPLNAPQVIPQSATKVFQFDSLEALPCGCVSAAYRSWHWGVSMVAIEAKGPHCILPNHALGQVLDLSDLYEDYGSEDDFQER